MNSKRLQAIAQLVNSDYLNIWDCCCDHGLLGIELLEKTAATVHFVDCEKHLIDKLKAEMLNLPQYAGRWRAHLAQVETLRLDGVKRQLLIIAGVGGDTCIKMVEALLKNHPGLEMDFILCPVRQIEHLRMALADHELGLLQECLVEERGRFYEVVHLRRYDPHGIPTTLCLLSPSDNLMHMRYIENRLSYFGKSSRSGCSSAFTHYKTLLASC